MATKKTTAATAVTPEPAYQYAATVVRVVDGDTMEVDIDVGFNIHTRQSVRFDGIDAPEKVGVTKAAGLAAKDALTSLLPAGTTVVLKTRKPATQADEKYGRLLARVWLDGKDLNQALLDRGLVKAYSGKGPRG